MTRTRLFRRPTALRWIFASGLLVPAALGFSATQAHAAGETIALTQNDPTAVVGRATNFTASGALNPDDTMFGFDIFVFVKDADADPTCAADFDTESANAMHSGGNESWVSPPGGFQVGMGPSFNQPFKITFTGDGNYLLCGYVNGDFSTFASSTLRGVVHPAQTNPAPPAPPINPAPPVNPTPTAAAAPSVVRAPWITRKRDVLTCHAGTWSNQPTSLRYAWYAKGQSRKLASARTLKVHRSLRGRNVTCRVTAANAAGHRTVSSRAFRAR
jgi:hypothetical protein